jgi:hypothetical protein
MQQAATGSTASDASALCLRIACSFLAVHACALPSHCACAACGDERRDQRQRRQKDRKTRDAHRMATQLTVGMRISPHAISLSTRASPCVACSVLPCLLCSAPRPCGGCCCSCCPAARCAQQRHTAHSTGRGSNTGQHTAGRTTRTGSVALCSGRCLISAPPPQSDGVGPKNLR